MSVHSGTSSKYMSEQRREKLLNIQKREQLKGMLIHKFKLKYGQKAENYINNEVGKFLNNNRLTEENLKKLDEKIGREAELRAKKEDVLSEHRSVKSGSSKHSRPKTVQSGASRGSRRSVAGSQKGENLENALSVKSYASSRMSGASHLSKKSKVSSNKDPYIAPDNQSQRSDFDDLASHQSRPMSTYSNLNEEDEWTAIMNFNTILHYEEQKQSAMREAERKRLIKDELDRQIRDKKARKRKEVEEDRLYDNLQEQHQKLLLEKEREREDEEVQKVEREKHNRDLQMKDEKKRKRVMERDEHQQEQQVVERLKDEMNQERQMMLEKRRQEREYLQLMLAENEKHKVIQEREKERERLEDVSAQDAYQKMLLQQENDRADEFSRREKRAQEFMGKMADTVLREMDQKAREEDDQIKQYEMD